MTSGSCLHGPALNGRNPLEEGNKGWAQRGKHEVGLNPTSKSKEESKVVAGGDAENRKWQARAGSGRAQALSPSLEQAEGKRCPFWRWRGAQKDLAPSNRASF